MEKLLPLLISIAVICAAGVFLALPIMWLWNWLMPEIFNICKIDFWQALGLHCLSIGLIKSSKTKG